MERERNMGIGKGYASEWTNTYRTFPINEKKNNISPVMQKAYPYTYIG
jgi:hypothetical protein